MHIILVMAILLTWVWVIGPEARANAAPFDPSDPRFAPQKEVPIKPGDKEQDDKGEKKAKETKKKPKTK